MINYLIIGIISIIVLYLIYIIIRNKFGYDKCRFIISLPDGRVVKTPYRRYKDKLVKRFTNLENLVREDNLFEIIDDDMVINIVPLEYLIKSTIEIKVKKTII